MHPHPCPYCGHTVIDPESHTSLPPSSITEEITSIIEQTRRLDEAISTLNVTRAKLLRRLNALQSPINNLPPEILSTAFSHVSPPIDFGASKFVAESNHSVPEIHGQMILSAVSSYWRQVVCSTPRLWATALINAKPRTIRQKTDLLELYLKNVGDVPFSLELHMFHSVPTNVSFPNFHPIFQTIQEGAQKFTLLALSAPPEAWFPLLSPHLQELKHLRLRWLVGNQDADSPVLQISHLSSIPSLRRVYFEHCTINWAPSDQPCHSITALHLVSIALPTCLRLLVLCPNLVEYRCDRCHYDWDTTLAERPPNSVTFRSMRFFQAPYSASMPFGGSLPILHFPVLEMFGLELDTMAPELENLLAFIRRLPVTCSALEIRGGFTDPIAIMQILQAAPRHVESLRLRDLDAWRFTMVLDALCNSTYAGSFIIPWLRHIHLYAIPRHSNFYAVESSGEYNQELFLDMLSARKELLPDRRFTLDIDVHDVSWGHLQDKLREMVSGGLRLEILVSGTLIPGLREIYQELDS